MDFMDETLKPLIEDGSKCIALEDLEVSAAHYADNETREWKIIMLLCMVFSLILNLVGVFHFRMILTGKDLRQKYSELD